MQNVEYCAD